MSRSAEGKFLDKLKSFYYLVGVCVCVCEPPYPLFLKNQLVLVSCISCVRRGKKCSCTARAEGFRAKEHIALLCGGS